jgi:D-alanine-D-alanine ligase-like ATP-grasp enzyme
MASLNPSARAMWGLAQYYKACGIWRDHSSAARLTKERRSQFYEDVWAEAAASRNGAVQRLGRALLEISCGDLRLRTRNSLTSLDDPVTLRIAGDKALVYQLLEGRGVPVPAHLVCAAQDLEPALQFMTAIGGPCVVKPARGTAAGAGITTGVTKLPQLIRAMARAGARCRDVIIEKQINGDNLRLLYLDGELLDAVRRLPPSVGGDGGSSIRELINAENADRLRNGVQASQTLLTIDWELLETLRNQGYNLGSVPPSGCVVRLKGVVNENRGSDNEAVDHLAPSVVDLGARAAATIGVRLAGVDVITPDASRPLTEAGGAVIEVNTTPGYYYHYHKRGERVPVASLILQRLAEAAS